MGQRAECPADTGTDRASQLHGIGRSFEGVDNKNEVREFLASRRARLSPEQAGLPAYGGNRRVPGLRREEVAMLAGVSVDYYTRLERGEPAWHLRSRARRAGPGAAARRSRADAPVRPGPSREHGPGPSSTAGR